jgi:hypothetical protein
VREESVPQKLGNRIPPNEPFFVNNNNNNNNTTMDVLYHKTPFEIDGQTEFASRPEH